MVSNPILKIPHSINMQNIIKMYFFNEIKSRNTHLLHICFVVMFPWWSPQLWQGSLWVEERFRRWNWGCWAFLWEAGCRNVVLRHFVHSGPCLWMWKVQKVSCIYTVIEICCLFISVSGQCRYIHVVVVWSIFW